MSSSPTLAGVPTSKETSTRSRRGFTLIELVVVMIVVALLIGLAVPSLTQLQGSARLTDSADRVTRLFRLARQHATTENRRVEIRFFRFADPDLPNSDVAYRAAMLAAPDPGKSSVQLFNLFRFPTGVVISDGPEFSSILALGSEGTETKFPIAGTTSTDFVSLTIRANGAIDGPPSEKYFVTLWQEQEAATGVPPKDYITIQVDPVSGGIETFRP